VYSVIEQVPCVKVPHRRKDLLELGNLWGLVLKLEGIGLGV
jgi:hypothetical protein